MDEAKTVGELVDRLPVPRQAVTPMQMLQIAVERGDDLDKLSKLMDLQERWEKREAEKAFVTSLNAFKKSPPTITKNKHVSFATRGGDKTEYDHATLDQICEVIGGALSDHGLSHRWEVDQAEGMVCVTCVLTHELGHSERVTLRAGADQSGGKNSIQAIGSTVTYLERYTLLAATGLAAKEQDDDGRTAESASPISPEQKEELIALLRDSESDTRAFLKYVGASAIDEIPASKFNDARAALVRKKEQKKETKQ